MKRNRLAVLLLILGLVVPVTVANAQPYDDYALSIAGRVTDVQRDDCYYDQDYGYAIRLCHDLIRVEYYTPDGYLMSGWHDTYTPGVGYRPRVDDIAICVIDRYSGELIEVRDWRRPRYYLNSYYQPWPRFHGYFQFGFVFYRYPVWRHHHPRWSHDHPRWWRDYQVGHPRDGYRPPPVRYKNPPRHDLTPPVHIRPGDRPELRPMPARPAPTDRDRRDPGSRIERPGLRSLPARPDYPDRQRGNQIERPSLRPMPVQPAPYQREMKQSEPRRSGDRADRSKSTDRPRDRDNRPKPTPGDRPDRQR